MKHTEKTILETRVPETPIPQRSIPESGTDAIRLNDVWVRYENQDALEAVSLRLPPARILSIVGPNGGGKTTLLGAILGLVKPWRGDVSVFGRNPKETRGIIGYMPQNSRHSLSFPVRVSDVVAMSRFARKRLVERLDDHDDAAIERALERVEMASLRDAHFGSLSGGQKQRVLIARALALEPRLLVLDEPSTGLDMVAQDRFYQLMGRLRDDGLTIVIVSHDIGSVTAAADQIACLNRRLHFHGGVNERIPSEVLEKVFGINMVVLHHSTDCGLCGES
jgi:zinc transport system ATP-binding protein